jgi:hypothetical protein
MSPYATPFVWIIFPGMVLGAMILIGLMLRGRQRLRELAIRERIALIEKGLVPSPEVDPARFEALVGLRRPVNSKASRYRSAGVIVMGLGAALTFLLAFAAGIFEVAIGIGGGLFILGLAAFINGTLVSGDDDLAGPRPS